MESLALINPRNVTEAESSSFTPRHAARAIVIDDKGDVALLHVSRDGYYKLPGGGVEDDEVLNDALSREVKEEIGCSIEVVAEVGSTTEHWQEDKERQVSQCFLAKLVGEKGSPELTDSEKERGFETVWLPYEEAMEALRTCKPTDWEADYIVPRELIFFEAAKDVFPMRKGLILPFNSKNEVLIQDRRGHKKPDWGYFGGTIEAGETPLEATIRETKEELSIEVTEAELIYLGVTVTNWEGHLNIRHHYLYRTEQGSFDVREGVGGCWLSFEEAKERMDSKDRFEDIVSLLKHSQS